MLLKFVLGRRKSFINLEPMEVTYYEYTVTYSIMYLEVCRYINASVRVLARSCLEEARETKKGSMKIQGNLY